MNVDSEIFGAYAFYATLMTIKMMLISFLNFGHFNCRVFYSSPDVKLGDNEVK